MNKTLIEKHGFTQNQWKKFVSLCKKDRPITENPFTHDGKLIVTDGKTLLWVKTDLPSGHVVDKKTLELSKTSFWTAVFDEIFSKIKNKTRVIEQRLVKHLPKNKNFLETTEEFLWMSNTGEMSLHSKHTKIYGNDCDGLSLSPMVKLWDYKNPPSMDYVGVESTGYFNAEKIKTALEFIGGNAFFEVVDGKVFFEEFSCGELGALVMEHR